MSLLEQHFGTSAPLPRLNGKDVLVGADPSVCKIKGVMLAGRKQFLVDKLGEAQFNALLGKISAKAAQDARTPLASSWYDFQSLVELDRAVYEAMRKQTPNVLALIGAASAELGIGKVYKMLDDVELITFLEKNALFHSQYQKFGNVRFERTADGGRMIYGNYPCYSPIYCASAHGFFLEAILRHGGTDPSVAETACQTLGDATCTFEMKWK